MLHPGYLAGRSLIVCRGVGGDDVSEMVLIFKYPFWGRHLFFKAWGGVSLILLTAPFLSYSLISRGYGFFDLYDSSIHIGKSGFYVVWSLILAVALLLDRRQQRYLKPIKITNGSIMALEKRNSVVIDWQDVKKIEKIERKINNSFMIIDEDYRNVGHDGVRVLSTNDKKIVIYRTIERYDEIISIVANKASREVM